ncbi:MAG TPA: hypothetical protein PL152_01150 [Steroidobacteraceae bacterium]|nr:hypothetical protein [Steroidobacteraceae bacterium]
MDQVSTADLLNLLLAQRSSIDLQFQFWLTITFAVLAAAFVAGDRLRWGLRWLAALLYALASAHLILRWMYDGTVGQHWIEELNRRGVDIAIPWPAVYLRMTLMGIGTVSSLGFLLTAAKRHPRLGASSESDRIP